MDGDTSTDGKKVQRCSGDVSLVELSISETENRFPEPIVHIHDIVSFALPMITKDDYRLTNTEASVRCTIASNVLTRSLEC